MCSPCLHRALEQAAGVARVSATVHTALLANIPVRIPLQDSRSFEESAQLFGDSRFKLSEWLTGWYVVTSCSLSLRYNESGHPDTAALILEKAAKYASNMSAPVHFVVVPLLLLECCNTTSQCWRQISSLMLLICTQSRRNTEEQPFV